MPTIKLLLAIFFIGFVASFAVAIVINVVQTSHQPIPPSGCHYQQVQCIKAPCDPILVCPSSTPTPEPGDELTCVQDSDCTFKADCSCEPINLRFIDKYPSRPGRLCDAYCPQSWLKCQSGKCTIVRPISTTPVQTSPSTDCVVGGCSGQLCGEPGTNKQVTTCEYRAEYACYSKTSCERQADGHCGWTPTPAFLACLQNPPPLQ